MLYVVYMIYTCIDSEWFGIKARNSIFTDMNFEIEVISTSY